MKEQYLELLDKLVAGKIDSFKFYCEFRERQSANVYTTDNLQANRVLLSPHNKSGEFATLISDIIGFCVSYEEIFEEYLTETETDLHYLEFRNSIEKVYLEIQELLNQTWQ